MNQNLNPKKKAKQIFQSFLDIKDPLAKYPMCYDTAKQASLFLVDEMLEATKTYVATREKIYNPTTGYEYVINTVYSDFWKSVQDELKLYN